MVHSSRSRPATRRVALGVATVIPMLAGMAVAGCTAGVTVSLPAAAAAPKPVPVYPVKPNKARVVPMTAWHPPAPSTTTASCDLARRGCVT